MLPLLVIVLRDALLLPMQWKSLLPIENTRGSSSLSQAEVPASGGLPAQVVPLLYLIQEGIAPPVLQASNQEAWRKSG